MPTKGAVSFAVTIGTVMATTVLVIGALSGGLSGEKIATAAALGVLSTVLWSFVPPRQFRRKQRQPVETDRESASQPIGDLPPVGRE